MESGALCRELDAEVAAIAEVAGEIAGCQALQAPALERGETLE